MRNLLTFQRLLLAGAILTATPAMASNILWTGIESSSWGNSQNWAPARRPGVGDTVFFGNGARATVNLGSDRTVDAMLFSGVQPYTLNGSSEMLTLEDITVAENSGLTTHTINTDVSPLSGASWEINGTAKLAVTGSLSGSTGISKRGTGTLILSGANGSYTGNLTVYGGELQAGVGDSLGDSTNVGLQAGGTLRIVGGERFGSFTGLGSVILEANGNVGYNNNDAVFNGVISGSGPLFKGGTGALTLGGANTYAGVTEVRNGTLKLNNTSGSATGSGAVEVQSGGTLTGGGSSSGTATILSGGTVVPGDGVGTLSLGGVTFNTAATLDVQIGGTSNHDVLDVSGTANLGGTLDLSYFGAFSGSPGDAFVVLTANSVSGAFDDVIYPESDGWRIEYSPTTVTVVVCAGGDCNGNGLQDDCEQTELVSKITPENRTIGCGWPTEQYCPTLRFGTDGIGNHTFRNVRTAASDVALRVRVVANLAPASSYIDLYVDNVFVGRVLETYPNNGGPCAVKGDTVMVDQQLWNQARLANGGDVPARIEVVNEQGCTNVFELRVEYEASTDCDGNGILDECELEDCNGNGVHDACEWDDDGDGVIDGCDECPGFDDAADADGDGVADGCDACPGFDDTIDCNFDGIPDACQLAGMPFTDSMFGYATCDPVTDPRVGFFRVAPLAISDVQLSVDNFNHNVDDAGESMDLFANGVFLATLFEDAVGCAAYTELTITAADWNTIRANRADRSVEIIALRNTASCGGVAACFDESVEIRATYTFDPDLNDNGQLDVCLPDCNPNDTDSDGDGVPDNCDVCPDTIADGSIVDAHGCPIHLSQVDADGDGDVDADDYANLGTGIAGPDQLAADQPLDVQGDGDLDLADVSVLQRAVRGSGVAADPALLVDQLPLFRRLTEPAWMTWPEADAYTKAIYGTHMAAIDESLSVSTLDQFTQINALAAQDPNNGTWFGLYFSSCAPQFRDSLGNCRMPQGFAWPRPADTKKWTWSSGGLFDYATQPDCFPDDPASPDPTPSGAYFTAVVPGTSCLWRPFPQSARMRSCLVQLPPTPVAPMPTATTETVNLYLDSTSDGLAVAAGTMIDWSIEFDVSTGDNAGLALLVTDLVQDAGNPEAFDLPPADGVPTSMSNFSAPAGISNPPEGTAASGYQGVQRGTPGALNLVQIGGGQNNLGAALPGGQVGQSATAVAGVGQSGRSVLASGSFTVPSTPGTYVFRLDNVEANVFSTVNAAPSASLVLEPNLDLADNTITITVVDGCLGDTDGDNDVDLSDLALLLSQFGLSGVDLAGDVDADGDVDLSDLATVLGRFGQNC